MVLAYPGSCAAKRPESYGSDFLRRVDTSRGRVSRTRSTVGSMTGHLTWYVARSTGLVGWALLTASVLWGLAISTKATVGGRRPRPSWMLDKHRTLGALASIFVVVHVVALIADSYVPFDLVSVLVPFASGWRPLAVAA